MILDHLDLHCQNLTFADAAIISAAVANILAAVTSSATTGFDAASPVITRQPRPTPLATVVTEAATFDTVVVSLDVNYCRCHKGVGAWLRIGRAF